MKTIKRSLLFAMIPATASLTMLAEPVPPSQETSDSEAKAQRVKGDSWRASQIIGTDVKNAADESIGNIEDLVIDYQSGEVLAVVVATGGFLGIGDSLSPVPLAALRFDKDADAFKTSLTKEQIQGAPHFTKAAWPDYDDPAVNEKYRSYRDVIVGDRNLRNNPGTDGNGSRQDRVDPADQGGSETDVNTTRKIRTAIMDADLSFGAKNVRIITKAGQITVKGEVKDEGERQKVLEIVRGHADSSDINDEITVEK